MFAIDRSEVHGEPAAWLPAAIDAMRKRTRRPIVVFVDVLDVFIEIEDSNSNAEVARRLTAVRAIAREKRVAIIGTGASAMQVGPEIQNSVGSLTIFQRSTHWAAPFER